MFTQPVRFSDAVLPGPNPGRYHASLAAKGRSRPASAYTLHAFLFTRQPRIRVKIHPVTTSKVDT